MNPWGFLNRSLLVGAGLLPLAGCSLEVTAPANQPPQAQFVVTPSPLPPEGWPQTVVTLDAFRSTDPENGPLLYEWTAPGATFLQGTRINSQVAKVRFSGEPPFIIRLRVVDEQGAEGTGTQVLDLGEPSDQVRFAADVQPIFTRNCTFTGCHGGAHPTLFPLEPGLSYAAIVQVSSEQAPALARVQPFEPDASYLYRKLLGEQDQVGGSGGQMPLGRTLTEAETETIRRWIELGARQE